MARRGDALTMLDRRSRRRARRQGRNLPRLVLRSMGVLLIAGLLVGAYVAVRSLTQTHYIPLRVLGADGRPLTGALIVNEAGREFTTVEGGSALVTFGLPETLTVTAPGYRAATYDVQVLPKQGPLALQMEPLVLQGRVTDSNGNGVVGATVTIGDFRTLTQEFGSFEIVEAMPGTVHVEKPAWVDADAEWNGSRRRLDVKMDPFMVRGLRVHPATAGDDEKWAEILRFADESAVNALVFDTKDELGNVTHETPGYEEPGWIGAAKGFFDAASRLAEAKEHGLYTITRIVTFQDPYASLNRNDWALHNSVDGDTWVTVRGLGWMDLTDHGSWEYPIRLGIEACRLGFDEIQFDYVRFPSDGDISITVYDNPEMADTAEARVATLAAFLEEARERINAEGCPVSADVFGIMMSVRNDQGIGQKIEELSWTVDAISPMVYPSHYGRGWLNLDIPNNYPHEVVQEALESGMIRMEGGALLRPWIQGFAWTTEQVQEALATATEMNMGWMLWNQVSEYELEWLPTD